MAILTKLYFMPKEKKPKKIEIKDVKKAILKELDKKQVSKEWVKSHLIITTF